MLHGRPALTFAILLALGIVAGSSLSVPAALLLAAAVVLLLVAIAVQFLPPSIPRLLPLPLLVILTGALLITADRAIVPSSDPSRFIGPDTVRAVGRVAEVAARSGGTIRFQLDCDSLGGPAGMRATEGRILVTLTGSAARALNSAGPSNEGFSRPGRALAVRGLLRPIDPARNPGEVDWGAHYRLVGIRAQMRLSAAGLVVPADAPPGGFVERFVAPVRRELSGRMTALAGEREGRFLNGLVLGERNEVPSDLREDFIVTGVMHLLAISGQQVALVALLLVGLLTVLRVPPLPRFLLLSATLGYYVLLTGASPSVTRAGIMAVTVLGASVVQRRPDLFQALGVAAAAILLAEPNQLFDPGFLLSFAAVLAIVLLPPVVLRAAPGITAAAARRRWTDLAWKGAVVSVAAGLGTAPIAAYFFGRVSLVGFAANLFVVPLSSLALVLGMLALAASFVWSWLAVGYAAAAEASAWLTVRLVGIFADFPLASVGFRITLPVLAAVYVLLGLFLAGVAGRSWKPLFFATLAALNIALFTPLIGGGPPDRLRVTFIDVGQGDAALLQFPGGRTMLVDGGPRSRAFDAGARRVVPLLRHLGVDRLDVLALSHPHGDHLGGLPAVLKAVDVGLIAEGSGRASGSLYAEFEREAESRGIPRIRYAAGDTVGGGLPARVYVLSPPREAEFGDLNNASIVLKVLYGGTSLLLTGDAEEEAEADLAGRYGPFLDADVLKTGHHGSSTSTTEPFLALVDPERAVISAGEGNRFGHPSPQVVGRLGRLGSAVERTDLSGAVILESDGAGWRRIERGDWP